MSVVTPHSTSKGRVTARELAAMDHHDRRLELIEGEVRTMSPAGFEHGKIASRIDRDIGRFVAENNLGETCAAETGFLIKRDPDTVRAPDFAFITQKRVDETIVDTAFWPGAPDLCVEVVSPSDLFTDVEQKALLWLECGSRIVWVVDPGQQHVTEYRGPSEIRILSIDAVLEIPDLLPGWMLPVRDIFPQEASSSE